MIIDKDIVEKSNLNRQFLFTKNDIGKYKTEVLRDSLKNRFDNLNITDLNLDISIKFEYKKFIEILEKKSFFKSLVILSADELDIIKLTNLICVKNSIPLINLGYFNNVSAVGPFYIPSIVNSSCLFCDNEKVELNLNNIDEVILDINNYSKMVPSWYVNNSIAVSIAAEEIINFVDNRIDKIQSISKKIAVSNNNFEKALFDFNKNIKCKFCGPKSKETYNI